MVVRDHQGKIIAARPVSSVMWTDTRMWVSSLLSRFTVNLNVSMLEWCGGKDCVEFRPEWWLTEAG